MLETHICGAFQSKQQYLMFFPFTQVFFFSVGLSSPETSFFFCSFFVLFLKSGGAGDVHAPCVPRSRDPGHLGRHERGGDGRGLVLPIQGHFSRRFAGEPLYALHCVPKTEIKTCTKHKKNVASPKLNNKNALNKTEHTEHQYLRPQN